MSDTNEPKIVMATADTENDALSRLVKWIEADVNMAQNHLAHIQEHIAPLMENVELRNREMTSALRSSEAAEGWNRSIEIVIRYSIDPFIHDSTREFLRSVLLPHLRKEARQ